MRFNSPCVSAVVTDPNAEPLHWLDVIQRDRAVYQKPFTVSHTVQGPPVQSEAQKEESCRREILGVFCPGGRGCAITLVAVFNRPPSTGGGTVVAFLRARQWATFRYRQLLDSEKGVLRGCPGPAEGEWGASL